MKFPSEMVVVRYCTFEDGKGRNQVPVFSSLAHLHPAAKRLFYAVLLLQLFKGIPLKEALVKEIERRKVPFAAHPLLKWLADADDFVVGRRFSTACYVDDSVPAVIYLALKYHDKPEEGLIANTNLGGDNAYRGAVLGAILGAANGIEGFPNRWINGLLEPPSDIDVLKSD